MSIRQGRDTPCVGVCNLLYVDVCQGCRRTAEEEIQWTIMTEPEEDAVWDRLIKQGWRPGVGVNSGEAPYQPYKDRQGG